MGAKGKWFVGLALLALLVWGLDQVVRAPLETGETYPAYSSLRSDPLGAKALYDSLAALPELSVERWYKTRPMAGSSATTVLVLGVDPVAWSGIDEKGIEELETLARNGTRLVLAFLPVRKPFLTPGKRPVEARWDLKLSYREIEKQDVFARGVPRHTSLVFEPGPEWRPFDPALTAIERPYGNGMIILVGETFGLSNEGLRDQRDAESIARLIGPSRSVIFDENHLGIEESGSVTVLMRKYNLEGAVFVLALVAALFLWRSATSFLPPVAGSGGDGAVAGRDSLEGL